MTGIIRAILLIFLSFLTLLRIGGIYLAGKHFLQCKKTPTA